MEGLRAGFSYACWSGYPVGERSICVINLLLALSQHCSRHSFCSSWPLSWHCGIHPHLSWLLTQLDTWVQVYVSVEFPGVGFMVEIQRCSFLCAYSHSCSQMKHFFFLAAFSSLIRKAKWHVCAQLFLFSTLFFWDRVSPWAWSSLVFTLVGIQQGSAILLSLLPP